MPIQRVLVYRGLESQWFDFDPEASVEAARDRLTSAGFIGPDTETAAWRFFIYSGTGGPVFADHILGKGVEPHVRLKELFGDGGQVYLTNQNATKKPDLMGIGATWFFNQHMSCRVIKNTEDESAVRTNEGKFDPYLLTHVLPTSTKVSGAWSNVVICEEGTAIGVEMASWAAAGFAYSLVPDQGEPIVSRLYVTRGEHPNTTARNTVVAYQNGADQIVIRGTSNLDIPGRDSLRYQRVTLRTWPLLSYTDGGTHYAAPNNPPRLAGPLPGPHGAAGPVDGLSYRRQLANGAVVPGTSVRPGAPSRGEHSDTHRGSISGVNAAPDTPYGEVVMYFFVFTSHEDAKTVIEGINTPNPRLWD